MVGCATITGFILTYIGRCYVWGIGSRTDLLLFDMIKTVVKSFKVPRLSNESVLPRTTDSTSKKTWST